MTSDLPLTGKRILFFVGDIYEDLELSSPDSGYYADRAEKAKKRFAEEWRRGLAVLRVDLGNDKIVWVLVIILLNGLGALIYLTVRRPERVQRHGH